MSRKLGREIILLIDDDTVACALDHTLETTTSEIEVNNPSNGVYLDFDPEKIEWTLTGSFIYDTSTENYPGLLLKQLSRSEVSVKVQDIAEEGFYYVGTAFISGLSKSAPHAGMTTFTMRLRGKGQLMIEYYYNLWADENDDWIMDENDDFIQI